jgi:cytoskeleton protein RodZ
MISEPGVRQGGARPVPSIGEALRSAREGQGATIDEAAAATRIRPVHLEALERDELGSAGGAVYAKGFLRQYASYLGLDPAPLLEAYQEQKGEAAKPPVLQGGLRPIEAGFGGFGRKRRGPNWTMLGSLAAAAVVVAGLISLLSARSGGEPEPIVAQPSTTLRIAVQGRAAAPARPRRAPAGVRLVLKWEGDSWVSVRLDGELEFQGTVEKGERRTYSAKRRVDLVLGNAGAVITNLNGRNLGPAGPPGQVTRRAYTPKGQVSASG